MVKCETCKWMWVEPHNLHCNKKQIVVHELTEERICPDYEWFDIVGEMEKLEC